MDVKDFYYDLPQELIAQDPLEDRSSLRLMVLDKNTGEVTHRVFKDITDYLYHNMFNLWEALFDIFVNILRYSVSLF